jgi:hypothetical protein
MVHSHTTIMVAVKDNYPRFTPEEYFSWKEQQLCRHEFIGAKLENFINYCLIIQVSYGRVFSV